jgi:hypothetical protein
MHRTAWRKHSIYAVKLDSCTLQQLTLAVTLPRFTLISSSPTAGVPVIIPPSPCASKPCDSKLNAVSGTCVAQGAVQFSCSCNPGYAWNSGSTQCTGGLRAPGHNTAAVLWGFVCVQHLLLCGAHAFCARGSKALHDNMSGISSSCCCRCRCIDLWLRG